MLVLQFLWSSHSMFISKTNPHNIYWIKSYKKLLRISKPGLQPTIFKILFNPSTFCVR